MRPPPGLCSWPARDGDWPNLTMSELLGRACPVTVSAKAADVAVVVAAAFCEWNDVVRHSCRCNSTVGPAVPTQRFHLQPTTPLLHGSTSSQSFGHGHAPKKKRPKLLGSGRNSHLYISEDLQHLQMPVNGTMRFCPTESVRYLTRQGRVTVNNCRCQCGTAGTKHQGRDRGSAGQPVPTSWPRSRSRQPHARGCSACDLSMLGHRCLRS